MSVPVTGQLEQANRREQSRATPSACGRAAAEADDVAVGVFQIKALRAPGSYREWLDNRCIARDTLLVERFDAVYCGCGVELFVITAVLTLGMIPGCFLQVKLQTIQLAARVEPIPRLAESEADLPVVRD